MAISTMKGDDMKTLVKAGAAAAVTASMALGMTPGSAGAAEVGLPGIKAAAHQAIGARVGALNTAIGVVQGSAFMGGDQSALVTWMQSDVSGLQQLDQTIQADSTTAAAKADAQKVFTDYRVYALVIPVVHMVRAADLATNKIAPDFQAAEPKLQAAITKQGATNLQPLLDDLKTQVANAVQLAAPLPGQLDPLRPPAWNANHALLQPYRQALETVRTDLRTARADARKIHAGLKK